MAFDPDRAHCIQPTVEHLEDKFDEPSQLDSNPDASCLVCEPVLVQIQEKPESSQIIIMNTQSSELGMTQTTTASSTAPSARIAGYLLDAKKQARLRQLRLRIPAIICGLTLWLIGGYLALSAPMAKVSIVLVIIANLGLGGGAYMLLLSLLPTDSRAVPLVGVFAFVPCTLAWCSYTAQAAANTLEQMPDDCVLDEQPLWCGWFSARIFYFSYCFLAGLGIVFRISFIVIRKHPAHLVLSTLWYSAGVQWLGAGVCQALVGCAYCLAGYFNNSAMLFGWAAGNFMFGGMMFFGTSTRRRVQSWFMSRGESAVAAAAVAKLLGQWQVPDVLSHARESFYYVSAASVCEEHMKDNRPNVALASFAKKGHLGLVDAFVSHSWHDDCDKKWIALQKFRDCHKRKYQREPLLWIDKYCIDQANIDESLACLPVYLAGCRKMLVLCGETYLQRLWCLIEIFTYLQMGGKVENLEVVLLETSMDESPGACAQEHDTQSNIEQMLYDFDPRLARCTSDVDTERLHAVIEAFGYGELRDVVKRVFLAGSIQTSSCWGMQ